MRESINPKIRDAKYFGQSQRSQRVVDAFSEIQILLRLGVFDDVCTVLLFLTWPICIDAQFEVDQSFTQGSPG